MILRTLKKHPFFRAKDALKEYKKHHEESERLIEDRESALSTVGKAEKKLKKKGGVLSYLKDDLTLTFELIRSYLKKEYRVVPKKTIIALLGAVIYLVAPIDVIFDFIPGLGYMDDAFVLGYVIKQVTSDLHDYRTWKNEKAYLDLETID